MRRRAARAVVVAMLALALAWVLAGGASAQACGPPLLPPCETTTVPSTTTTTEASTTTTTEASTTTTTQPTATSQPQQQPQQQQQTATTLSRSTAPVTQPPTPTTAAPSLLVPGPDPGSVTAATTVDGQKAGAVSNEDNTGTVVGLVIGALLLVALIVGLLTYRFWRNTRPATVASGD